MRWEVDLDDLYKAFDRPEQVELGAIHEICETDGPEGIGIYASELEGVPNWHNLGSTIVLEQVPVLFPKYCWFITVEIMPDFKMKIWAASKR